MSNTETSRGVGESADGPHPGNRTCHTDGATRLRVERIVAPASDASYLVLVT